MVSLKYTLYSWEDIIDLIFENKATYDYYLKRQTFKKNYSVKVTFKNEETEMTACPKFLQKVRMSRTLYEELERQVKGFMPNIIRKMLDSHSLTPEIFSTSFYSSSKQIKINRSFFNSKVLVANNGSEPLEHWELTLFLSEDVNETSYENHEKKRNLFSTCIYKCSNKHDNR